MLFCSNTKWSSSTESIRQRWNQMDWRRLWWIAASRLVFSLRDFSSSAIKFLNKTKTTMMLITKALFFLFTYWPAGWDSWLLVRCPQQGRRPWSWLRGDERPGHREEEKAPKGASFWHGKRTTFFSCAQSSHLTIRFGGWSTTSYICKHFKEFEPCATYSYPFIWTTSATTNLQRILEVVFLSWILHRITIQNSCITSQLQLFTQIMEKKRNGF